MKIDSPYDWIMVVAILISLFTVGFIVGFFLTVYGIEMGNIHLLGVVS